MNQDYPLDETIPIRRFVKLRHVPKAGEGVYRTYLFAPIEILEENGWKKLGRSKSKPDRWYLRSPDPQASSPFPITVHIPTPAAVLKLAADLVANCPESDCWEGRLGLWRGLFEPKGPSRLCGTILHAMSEEEQRQTTSPILRLGLPLVWHTSLRWYEGLQEPPTMDLSEYVSHLERIQPYY